MGDTLRVLSVAILACGLGFVSGCIVSLLVAGLDHAFTEHVVRVYYRSLERCLRQKRSEEEWARLKKRAQEREEGGE